MDVSPGLPLRFPCWCRAVYSWGGESKKDLGFVEGDLIECLNAGDGSWWMGRLRRDRRAMGLFPSNFVKVLDDSFVPVNRATSPMPDPGSAGSTPPKSKGTMRKPFQSYSAPTAPLKKPELRSRRPSPLSSPAPSRQGSYLQQPRTNSNTPSRQSSHLQNPCPMQSSPSRQNSYLQHDDQNFPTRQNSYLQYNQKPPSKQNSVYGSRAPSPDPHIYGHTSRQPSPNPYDSLESSPPPPPPPHRIAYQPQRTPSPAPSTNGHYHGSSRGPSPIPHSPATHLTPSPLRDAMDDVMSSLHDMAVRGDTPSPTPEAPLDPWSPEAFEELNPNPRKRHMERAQTSLGLGASNEGAYPGQQVYSGHIDDKDMQGSDYHQRMQHRLRSMHDEPQYSNGYPSHEMGPPALPSKSSAYHPRPVSSIGTRGNRPMSSIGTIDVMHESRNKLRSRKSAYELGRGVMERTFTHKSTVTNVSSGTQSTNTNSTTSTQLTNASVMSGQSAGGFSATSAGSLARRKGWGSFRKPRPATVGGTRFEDLNAGSRTRPQSPVSGISYHSSHNSVARPLSAIPPEWDKPNEDTSGPLGGFAQLKPKRSGFLRKLVDSAKAGAASTRSSIAGGGQEVSRNPVKSYLPNGTKGISSSSAAQDMGLGGGSNGAKGIDWVQVRRDVNRSNSMSKNERQERTDRCQILGQPVVDSVDLLEEEAEGDEGIDCMPISEPTNFQTANLQLVDKSARFVSSLPPMTNPISLAQGYVCRPYRSDVQRFRAIFTWVSEKIGWEEDFEGQVDSRRVIQTLRGCAQEVAVLTMEMCQAVGLHAEVVRGYLKPPNELPELESMPRPNHWWNAVLVDGEWRIMDCSLASPTNPKRSFYSSAPSAAAETFYFLTRPLEACYTHIPSTHAHQHIVPPIDVSILLALPCALPPYFRNDLHMIKYSTALLYIDALELMHITLSVPPDTELFAEVCARAYARDADGDYYDSGEITTKRALAQAEWKNGAKRYIIKALLPGDEGQGTLKVYAGKRGLMHGIKDNPHPLALSLPIYHQGGNPPFDFLTRHPTPHAQRHDLYLVQPQCRRLACNNTFVFSVRQHPSSLTGFNSPTAGRAPSPSPLGFNRPASAMSMASSSASGSNPSTASSSYFGSQPGAPGQLKPAKLAVQAPSGKILRLSRKVEGGLVEEGGTWETVIKVGERGTWRGLVLADRSARWCVWGEWECI